MNKINIFAGNENTLRAYEICKAGNFKMKLFTSENIDGQTPDSEQMRRLNEWLGEVTTQDTKEAHILIECVNPDFGSIISQRKTETIEDVKDRLKSFKKADFDPVLNEASQTLLKTAYVRLGLQPYEIEIILNVAKAISQLDDSTNTNPMHIAEAIQYRSIDKEIQNK